MGTHTRTHALHVCSRFMKSMQFIVMAAVVKALRLKTPDELRSYFTNI